MSAPAARLRALIHRPGRKMHLASLAAGEAAWLTFCDRSVPVDGTAYVADGAIAAAAGETHAGAVCAHCHRMALVAALVAGETRAELEARQQQLLATVWALELEAAA